MRRPSGGSVSYSASVCSRSSPRLRRANRCWSCCRPTATSRRKRSFSIPMSSTRRGARRSTFTSRPMTASASWSRCRPMAARSAPRTSTMWRRASGCATSFRVVQYPTAGGSVEWAPDNSGFYYTRYPREGERPAADRAFLPDVWFHQLGTPVSADRYVIGRDFPRIAEIGLEGSRDGRLPARQGAEWRRRRGRVPPARSRRAMDAGCRLRRRRQAGDLWRRRRGCTRKTIKDALRGRIIAHAAGSPDACQRVSSSFRKRDIVAESVDGDEIAALRQYRNGGPSTVRMFGSTASSSATSRPSRFPTPASAPRLAGDDLLVLTVSYSAPPTWFRFEAARDRLAPTQLMDKPAFDFKDAAVRPRRRDFQGRHPGSDQHPVPEGHEPQRPQSGHPLRAMAATVSA